MKLDVIFNKISGLGMLDFVKSAANVSLSLSDNVISIATARTVVFVMVHSEALKSVFLDHCDIITEGESHVACNNRHRFKLQDKVAYLNWFSAW